MLSLMPPPSGAASPRTSTLSRPPPTLMAGSTHSSSDSVLAKNIQVTQNTRVAATNIKKEHAYIEVEDGGIISDYDEMNSQEQYRALTSPFKNGVCATSSVSHSYILFLSRFGLTIIHQNMVTENQSKSIAPPKGSKPFKRSDLPNGLNYEVLCHTIIPTVIAYYACQKDPWDQLQSILWNEICVILRSASGMDFNINQMAHLFKCTYYRLLLSLSSLICYSMSFRQLVSCHWLCLISSYHNLHL